MNNEYNKGILFAFGAALISGFAVYLNKFGVALWSNPSVYTTAKNIVAAIVLLAVLMLTVRFKALKTLPRRVWGKLLLIGLIGGSIPFLLFFTALSMMPASEAAFIHKTLFLWVALLAAPFLGEKIGKLQLMALAILLLGVYLFGTPKTWSLGLGTLLAFGATLLWAVENIIAKKVLSEVPGLVGASARMFFGSMFLLIYLAFTGDIAAVIPASLSQASWTIVVGFVLFGFVACWYAALERAPATVVASILVIAAPITTILENVIGKHTFPTQVILPGLVMIAGALLISNILPKLSALISKKDAQQYS